MRRAAAWPLVSFELASGGHIFVFAVKPDQTAGEATIVCRNIHQTLEMQSTYKIAFAVFN